MPDGDVFSRRAAVGWSRLARAVGGGMPVEGCARQLESDLAKDLRRRHGLHDAELAELLSVAEGTTDEARIERALAELVRRKVFDRIAPLLVGPQRFRDYGQAEHFIQSCLAAANLHLLARRLARRPDAFNLRKPPRPRSRTSELLTEVAPLGERA